MPWPICQPWSRIMLDSSHQEEIFITYHPERSSGRFLLIRMRRLVELLSFYPVFCFNPYRAAWAQCDKTNRLRADRHHFTEARSTVSSSCSIFRLQWSENECHSQDLFSTYETQEERGSTPIASHFVSSLFILLIHMFTINSGIHTRMHSLANLQPQSLLHI